MVNIIATFVDMNKVIVVRRNIKCRLCGDLKDGVHLTCVNCVTEMEAKARLEAYRDAKAIVVTQDKRNAIDWLEIRLKQLKEDSDETKR